MLEPSSASTTTCSGRRNIPKSSKSIFATYFETWIMPLINSMPRCHILVLHQSRQGSTLRVNPFRVLREDCYWPACPLRQSKVQLQFVSCRQKRQARKLSSNVKHDISRSTKLRLLVVRKVDTHGMLRTRPNALQKHEGSSCQQEQTRSLANHCMCPQVRYLFVASKKELTIRMQRWLFSKLMIMMMMVMMMMITGLEFLLGFQGGQPP